MLRREFVRWMPSLEEDVLPTRFGNAIKAFEVYPRDIYGARSASLSRLRLVSVLPSFISRTNFQGALEVQIDFFVIVAFFPRLFRYSGVAHLVLNFGDALGCFG